MNIEEIFAELAALADDPATVQTITDISTGEGGVAKIVKVSSDLLTLFHHVTTALSVSEPVASPAVTVPGAAA